ncbi:hypothetical protein KIH74_13700 [Kineosporia sp. J2-2]|uniref:Uncharacterized protein n=1 Tax=Kineosporia corallincola TaxID=2835133 RepID=A0ABS5TFW3_9ACTN|nr:hypothetical protein [Kineosporia corallincola]MBT0769987.1 hypothetical protein [Kineosporia corallincola]
MSSAVVEVTFTQLPEDDDFVLDQLTEELAEDLQDTGDVRRVEAASSGPESKGIGELLLATLVVAADPAYVQALVELVTGFLGRNRGRTAHLRVGDVDVTLDGLSPEQTSEIIDIVRGAVERSR